MLSNAYFLAKFRFDTAENEPAKKLQNFSKMHFRKIRFLRYQKARLQPLLADLEQEFKAVADESGFLSAGKLAKVWYDAAKEQHGYLSKEEKELILVERFGTEPLSDSSAK